MTLKLLMTIGLKLTLDTDFSQLLGTMLASLTREILGGSHSGDDFHHKF
jgi:hypothetical protein